MVEDLIYGDNIMQNWLVLTLVDKYLPGIVAKVSQSLFDMQGNPGEASMTRFGDKLYHYAQGFHSRK